MTQRLEQKVAFITGVVGGQGRTAAEIFAREGAIVVGCDIDGDGAQETAGAVENTGGTMSAAQVDLRDPVRARAWLDAGVLEHGRMNILYNNAAGVRFAAVDDKTAPAAWRFTLDSELDPVFTVVQHAWPHLCA